VLLVEDDEQIGSMLASALSVNGHEVDWQRTGRSATLAVSHGRFDLALLDLGLPDVDGMAICRELKHRQPDTIVVILTARHDEMDVVAGLESGADDYLLKPFRMTELLARVRAHLRRTEVRPVSATALAAADLTVDAGSRRCWVNGREIGLRPKEFDLLARLLSTPGVAVSRDQLMADVWDENWYGSTKTLDVHVAALRHRLADAANYFDPVADVPAITTLRNFGYRLEAPQTRPDG
jgi:DNA-binding response OmpR family regulator